MSPGSEAVEPAALPPPNAERGTEADAAILDAIGEPTPAPAASVAPVPKPKAPRKSRAKPKVSVQPRPSGVGDEATEAVRSSPAPSAAEGGLGLAQGSVEGAAGALAGDVEGQAEAGPSALPASVKKPARSAPRRTGPKQQKVTEGHHHLQYTNAFVPGQLNIKTPVGDYGQRETNHDVIRQTSQARARLEKETLAAEKAAAAAANGGAEPASSVNPLDNIIIIQPGSRTLRIARASKYEPYAIPNCIARARTSANWGTDPPVPGSRVKRLAARAEEERHSKKRRKENGETHENGDGDVEMDGPGDSNGNANGNGHGGTEEGPKKEWVNPIDSSITALRDYLKEHLRLRRLSTNFDEVRRIRAANSRIKPETLPEYTDPFKIEWVEVKDKAYYTGEEALRLPPSADFSVRWPILNRQLNTRDWSSSQLLMDDIGLIILDAMRKEMGIELKDLPNFSVVLVVPDHGDRFYVQEMTTLLMGTMGFREIAIHQESYTSIFCAGMSSSCVVDIGATRTSIALVDEGILLQDSRVVLNYGGDDVTIALAHLLERAAFPYKEVDLARAQDWLLVDGLKSRICTLEEHLVANTQWDFAVVREVGLTQKYVFRTFDENVLAPLTWFDTSMIDFTEKKGAGRFRIRGRTKGVSDTLQSSYDEITAAMDACTKHLWNIKQPTKPENGDAAKAIILVDEADDIAAQFGEAAPATSADGADAPRLPKIIEMPSTEPGTAAASAAGTPAPEARAVADADTASNVGGDGESAANMPLIPQPAVLGIEYEKPKDFDVYKQSSESALDGAIAAAISQAGSENKTKVASANILLIGGASAMKGLPSILQDRLPHLIKDKTNFNIDHVSIVPPPRNLKPEYVSWKGASVMCNLEALSDMWIRRDEWEALGARALKDRCSFL